MQDNIHPIFDTLLLREERELYFRQKSKALWLTGLSGSGKSTIGRVLERKLFELGFYSQVLDGDNIRAGICNNLGFSIEDRKENIRRVAEISKLYIDSGLVTINSFISPTIAIRNYARQIIGSENFIEIFIDTPLEVCEQRDIKGLYKKARAGEIKGFTGIDSPYEAPEKPDIHIKTLNKSIDACVKEILDFVLPQIVLDKLNIINALQVKHQKAITQ